MLSADHSQTHLTNLNINSRPAAWSPPHKLAWLPHLVPSSAVPCLPPSHTYPIFLILSFKCPLALLPA